MHLCFYITFFVILHLFLFLLLFNIIIITYLDSLLEKIRLAFDIKDPSVRNSWNSIDYWKMSTDLYSTVSLSCLFCFNALSSSSESSSNRSNPNIYLVEFCLEFLNNFSHVFTRPYSCSLVEKRQFISFIFGVSKFSSVYLSEFSGSTSNYNQTQTQVQRRQQTPNFSNSQSSFMNNIAALLSRESLGDYVSFIETSIMSAISSSSSSSNGSSSSIFTRPPSDTIIDHSASAILEMAVASMVGTIDVLAVNGFISTESVLAIILRMLEKMVNILKSQSEAMRKSQGTYYYLHLFFGEKNHI